MAMRRIGSKVKLTPKAVRLLPRLDGMVGKITTRPIRARERGDKVDHTRYGVDFGREGGSFSIRASDLRSM